MPLKVLEQFRNAFARVKNHFVLRGFRKEFKRIVSEVARHEHVIEFGVKHQAGRFRSLEIQTSDLQTTKNLRKKFEQLAKDFSSELNKAGLEMSCPTSGMPPDGQINMESDAHHPPYILNVKLGVILHQADNEKLRPVHLLFGQIRGIIENFAPKPLPERQVKLANLVWEPKKSNLFTAPGWANKR